MKRLKLSLFILVAIAQAAVAQVSQRLTFTPERPVSGQPVTLNYTPLPSMTGNQTIRGVAYTYENYQWRAHDIEVRNDGTQWRGTFTPSEHAGLMTFKFVADTITDNNDGLTFGMLLTDKTGKQSVGAYAAWGLLRSQSYGKDIPGYIDYTRVSEVSDTIVYYWLNNEVTRNQQTAVHFAPLYIRAMRAAKINDAEGATQRAVKYLLGVGTEEALNNALSIMQLTDDRRADSLSQAIVRQYPKGLLALRSRVFGKYDYRDTKAMKEHFAAILRDFPRTEERDAYLRETGHGYDESYLSLMIFDWMEHKTDAFRLYADSLSFYGLSNAFYKMVELSHMHGDYTDAELLPHATRLVDRMLSFKGRRPESLAYLSESEWAAEVDKTIGRFIAEPYSEILKSTGNLEKALAYSRLAQEQTQYKRSEINDNMAEILKALGKDTELKDLLEKSVFNNQVSELQTTMLKALYVKEKGSEAGYDAYVEALKNPQERSAIQKAVEAYRRSGTMPAWSLKDADGKTITSKDMTGKVYVIDFWANWCHPCKASLPGMKQAADHYKADKSVEFLFVDTQETIKDYQAKAKAYLKEKGLDIHLLFDGTSAGKKTNDELCEKVMRQYKTSGIPMKVVVDAKGEVRFLAIGYKGSPSALCDEMIEMVEQAKK